MLEVKPALIYRDFKCKQVFHFFPKTAFPALEGVFFEKKPSFQQVALNLLA
jgi:hypothetical protein